LGVYHQAIPLQEPINGKNNMRRLAVSGKLPETQKNMNNTKVI